MEFVIRVEELVGINASGRDAEQLRGSFVASYDPSAFGGRGDLELTKDWSRARLFPTRREAWEYWQQSYGERPDGKPNRPLTAFTCTILTLSQAVLEAQAG